MSQSFRVLGIDVSLRSTGLAVVESRGSALQALDQRTVRILAGRPRSACLRALSESLVEVINAFRPDAVAIEGAFYHKNVKTAAVLGEARGAAIAACACAGLPVYELAPRRVKQAVVGYGAADKGQVRQMVMKLLALNEEPQEDAGDALALAICHLQSRSVHADLAPKPI